MPALLLDCRPTGRSHSRRWTTLRVTQFSFKVSRVHSCGLQSSEYFAFISRLGCDNASGLLKERRQWRKDDNEVG